VVAIRKEKYPKNTEEHKTEKGQTITNMKIIKQQIININNITKRYSALTR